MSFCWHLLKKSQYDLNKVSDPAFIHSPAFSVSLSSLEKDTVILHILYQITTIYSPVRDYFKMYLMLKNIKITQNYLGNFCFCLLIFFTKTGHANWNCFPVQLSRVPFPFHQSHNLNHATLFT